MSLSDLNWDEVGAGGALGVEARDGRSGPDHIGGNGLVRAFRVYAGVGEHTARFSAETCHDQLHDIVSWGVVVGPVGWGDRELRRLT